VILGARSMDQLTGNMAAAELTLTPEETHLLDKTSEPPTPGLPPTVSPASPSAAAASREGDSEGPAGARHSLNAPGFAALWGLAQPLFGVFGDQIAQ
jgi:hypothetical protein